MNDCIEPLACPKCGTIDYCHEMKINPFGMGKFRYLLSHDIEWRYRCNVCGFSTKWHKSCDKAYKEWRGDRK